MKYLSNRLGIFGKNSSLPAYSASFEIGGITTDKIKVVNHEDVLKRDVVSGTRSQKKAKFGKLERFERFSDFNPNNFIKIDLSENHIVEQIQVNPAVFFTQQALRLAAKVAYEWHCKQNSINGYDASKFERIVDYIVKGTQDESVVRIVVDADVYAKLNERLELGSHTLLEFYSDDGGIDVLFSFFGLVIYIVRICQCRICFPDDQNAKGIAIRYDGYFFEDVSIRLSSKYLMDSCQTVNKAKYALLESVARNVCTLLATQLLTLENLKYIVDEIKAICMQKTGDERYNELIGYNNDRRIMVISILYRLGIQKTAYFSDQSFSDNIKRIFGVEEILIFKDDSYKELRAQYLDNTEDFLQALQVGIDLFDAAW